MTANPRKIRTALLASLLCCLVLTTTASAAFVRDREYQNDRIALDKLQQDAFRYFWEFGEPNSGMALEANFYWESTPIAVGGTGFGIAALVVAVDREWVDRSEAVARLLQITSFLKNRTQRLEMHGAFPHWLDGATGRALPFGERDGGADIVETSFLMQGLLIARVYFNGPGVEAKLRDDITELWEGVDWNWFTNGEDNGLYWHWEPEKGFYNGLKIRGYNECLLTYVLAAASPTRAISEDACGYWRSGPDYQPRIVSEYTLEASPSCGGPLFMAQYSFIGLDPRRLADGHVKQGYFVRSVTQTLANRGYCLYEAPEENRYSEDFWGLSASHSKAGYAANSPCNDQGAVAPTAALSSLPFTPHYSMRVLHNLNGVLKKKVWGDYGPFDGISLRDDWVSRHYLSIDQLPMVCMAENYRTGLLWNLFMRDRDIGRGLQKMGLRPPEHEDGFPEAVVAFKKVGGRMVPDAYDIRRHPDTGLYEVPFFVREAGPVTFAIADLNGEQLLLEEIKANPGRNTFRFPQFMPGEDEVLTLTMQTEDKGYSLPLRLH